MLKRLSVALAALFVLATQSFAAGTIPLSLSQQFDKFGHVLAGCKLNIIQAGTVGTPQIAYQDTALTIPVPGGSQLTCDASGRIQQFFLADGNIKVLLTDANGVTQFTADNILVIGNSSGGGGGSPVDPTTILQTGDIKAVYGTGVVTGFVRLNGRTIGSASSGATERANSDTQALFQYLWATDVNLPVSTGRGVSANADWVANKQLTLPDARDRALAGLGDMGNSDAARFTASYFGTTAVNAAGNNCAPTSLGCAAGGESQTLTLAQAPTGITSAVNVAGNVNLDILFANTSTGFGLTSFSANSGGQVWQAFSPGAVISQTTTSAITSSGSATSSNTSGQAHPIVSPVLLVTLYAKL